MTDLDDDPEPEALRPSDAELIAAVRAIIDSRPEYDAAWSAISELERRLSPDHDPRCSSCVESGTGPEPARSADPVKPSLEPPRRVAQEGETDASGKIRSRNQLERSGSEHGEIQRTELPRDVDHAGAARTVGDEEPHQLPGDRESRSSGVSVGREASDANPAPHRPPEPEAVSRGPFTCSEGCGRDVPTPMACDVCMPPAHPEPEALRPSDEQKP